MLAYYDAFLKRIPKQMSPARCTKNSVLLYFMKKAPYKKIKKKNILLIPYHYTFYCKLNNGKELWNGLHLKPNKERE